MYPLIVEIGATSRRRRSFYRCANHLVGKYELANDQHDKEESYVGYVARSSKQDAHDRYLNGDTDPNASRT
jgi:hypothetical protein